MMPAFTPAPLPPVSVKVLPPATASLAVAIVVRLSTVSNASAPARRRGRYFTAFSYG